MANEKAEETEGDDVGASEAGPSGEGGVSSEPESLRDTVAKAFEKASGEAKPEAKTSKVTDPDAAQGAKGRDEKGRFKTGQAQGEAAGTKAVGPVTPQAGVTPPVAASTTQQVPLLDAKLEKPPASWKPGVREQWGALPPEVRAEVLRRESEAARGLQDGAEHRKVADAYRQAVAPYEPMIRAEGGDPVKAVGALLQTAAALRTAPAATKAQIVAGLVRDFGIDVAMLDAALSGGAMPGGQQAPAPYRDPRVDELLAKLSEVATARSQSLTQKATSELEQFAASKEFFEDVREDMGDLMEVAAKRGVELDYETAYNRAIAMNPELSQILTQRAAATNANPASTSKARNAASSVRSKPVQSTNAGGNSLRDDVAEIYAELAGRT